MSCERGAAEDFDARIFRALIQPRECWWTSPIRTDTNEKSTMMKSSGTAAVGFLVVTVLWRLVIGGNRDIWCRWKTPCLLEANFPISGDVVIHWKRWLPSRLQVHNFDYGKDQLQEQDQHFRGRTSLFKENIPKGNASLLITNVLVADEGIYMCHVGTLTERWRSVIKLNVEAAVTSIRLRLNNEDQLICSSGGIFPQPELRWSTEPALPDALRNSSQVQQETQTQLYNINGSLALAGDAHPDLEYICEISNTVSGRRTTWKKTTNRRTSLQPSYWWINGLEMVLIVLVLAALLVYPKMRGKAAKSSSCDPEEEIELNSVKGVEGESEKSNQLPARGNNGQTGPS